VTGTDRLEFAQAFNILAVSTRLPTGEADAAMQEIYWRGLEDLPVDVVALAAESLSKASQWFPKVSEWREAATELRLQQVLRLPPGREEPWQHECEACQDGGWEVLRCYPGTGKNCGRKRCMEGGGSTYEHGYAVRCSCRDTNRTFQRHHTPKASRAVYQG
jgi:hypothetical protein